MRLQAHEGRSYAMKNPQDRMTRQSMVVEDPALPPDFSDDMDSWDLRIPELDDFDLESEDLTAPDSEPSSDDPYCCVFMESGYETLVGKVVEYCGEGRVAVPRRIVSQYRRDQWRDVIKPLLPGYLFIRGEPDSYRLRRINHVIRPLRYESGETALQGDDLVFASLMFRLNGTIPKLQAIVEDDFVHVTDSLLSRMNGTVLSVNKRNRLAKVEINLLGRPTTFWLGLDLP